MRSFAHFSRALAWTLALLLAAAPALAQRVEGDRASGEGMYEAEVQVRNQSESERETGIARALAQVLAKLSGDRSIANRPGVGQELRRAGDYVEGYDYRQDESVGPSGAPTFRTMLVVRFDPAQVDSVAAALGLPVWPQPRPKPVVWLAIDDGKGPRLVGLQHNTVARPLLERAVQRGYRLGLPTGSAAEQAAVGAIWRGDTGAIARLSARYQPPMQLIGKLYRDGAGWKADWIFVDNGRVLSRWSEEGADARRTLATGADGGADALIKRYAKATAPADPVAQRMVFTGVRTGADYLRLSAALQRMSVVRAIRPQRAMPDRLEVELDLLTGLAGFRRMADDGVLLEMEGEDALVPVYLLR
ncbi:DUF2066 domain-containing protein [Luteimonas sp. M1R5S18]|uniref:DUF2066 domain-containing protein n=1 Tax=Luteimonas rhizosphaericola TaxID=3042024 RepID=A0ABT6JKH2_9GAMM|nr:DUF2066 domain-containing protein [Luteimonas rhizosphaericola]MDH5831175.1 DUF2066 domain-containing protein [Luteimonas rhizosphaericola]